MRTRTFLKAAALGVALPFAPAGWAQPYPAKPVKFIGPFPAGSATDLAARVIANALQEDLGQSVVVDNKPGAGGSIAAMEVVRAAPDGYTLLFSSNSAMASNVALLKNMPYDPRKDLTPVAAVGYNMLVLMTRSDHPAASLQTFVEYAKKHPGQLSAGYGSSSSQICIAVLNKLGGLDTRAIPYKGIPLAVNDVIGGSLDFTFVDLGNAIAQAKGGRMRALGVTSLKRSALEPEWPSIAEVMPGFDVTAWFAIGGPAKLPGGIVDRLNAAAAKALAKGDVKTRLAGIGIQPMVMRPAELQSFVEAEVDKWIRLAQDANIEPQ